MLIVNMFLLVHVTVLFRYETKIEILRYCGIMNLLISWVLMKFISGTVLA